MLKIKLFQRGKKHQRSYRIVVAEARSKRDGKFVADLGFYNPQENKIKIDRKSLADWQQKGAQLTDGVRKLLSSNHEKTN